MYDWRGFIKFTLTPEKETLLALSLAPTDFNLIGSPRTTRRYNTIQNGLFQLGALQSGREYRGEYIEYLALFPIYFSRQQKYYQELYDFLFQNKSQFIAFFRHIGGKESIHITYEPHLKIIQQPEYLPQEYKEHTKQLDDLIEWLGSNDTYIPIVPPNGSIFGKK